MLTQDTEFDDRPVHRSGAGQDTEYDNRLAYSQSNWTRYRVRWQVSTQVRLLNSNRSSHMSGYWTGYKV